MSEILTHIDAGILTLTLNRVDKKNSITAAMYSAMATAVQEAANNDTVRVLVIQGHETIFSAGNDIADFLNNPPATEDAPVFHFLRAISTIAKPVVAAVAGRPWASAPRCCSIAIWFTPATTLRLRCRS